MCKRLFLILTILFFVQVSSAQWTSTNGPPAGTPRVYLHPANPDIVYAVSSKIYKSIDGGSNWEMLEDLNLSTSVLSIDQFQPETLYVGTNPYLPTMARVLFRSTNGGQSWDIVRSGRIYSLFSKAGRVIALSDSGLILSSDGGISWSTRQDTIKNGKLIVDELDDLWILYNNQLFYSADTGKSLSKISLNWGGTKKNFDVTSLKDERLITITSDSNYMNRVHLSSNSGINWYEKTDTLPSPLYEIKISRNNLSHLFIGTQKGFYRSTNGGNNWEKHNDGIEFINPLSPSSPTKVVSLAISSTNSNLLFAGNDFGLYKSTNYGEQWQYMSIPTGRVFTLSNNVNSTKVYCSSGQSGGVFHYNGVKWNPTTMLGCDIHLVAVSPYNSSLVLSTIGNDIFEALLFQTTDGGTTWNFRTNTIPGEGFFTKILFDPLDSNRVYASYVGPAHGIQISTNQGVTWTILTNYLLPVDLDVNPKNNQMLYALEEDGIIFRSTNRGTSWTQIRSSTDSQHTRIRFDPFEPAIMYLGSYTLFKSDDSGFTWRDLSFNKKVSDITFDTETGEMFIGTSLNGVWRSSDGGNSFIVMAGLPSQEVTALHFYKRWGRKYLMAGSGSLGAYEYDLGPSVESPTEITVSQNVTEGWNLLSVPVASEFFLKDSLFPTSSTPAFIYSDGYVTEDSLQSGKGFWLKYDTEQSLTHTGEPTFIDTIEVIKGWNLIGSISYPVSASTITSIPADIVLNDFYGFNGTYYSASNIEPGRAYWVRVKSNGYLVVFQSSVTKYK